MFSAAKKPEQVRTDRIDTIVGESAVIEGIIKMKDTTRVDGTIKGEGISEGMLIIGESGLIEGDVKADSMLVAGKVIGNLYIKNRLEITDSGQVIGDVATKILSIAEGATFEGKCTMLNEKNAGFVKNEKKEASVNGAERGAEVQKEKK